MPGDTEDKGPSEGTSKPSDYSALSRRNILLAGTTIAAATAINTVDRTQVAQAQPAPAPAPQPAAPSGKKPNILIIWGDDAGVANISAYSNGLMGYETPSIDRIGREGIKFQHYYGEQSCTAGRSAFLTGQHIIRSGLSKVGFPGAPMGMSQLDPSIGGLLADGSVDVYFGPAPPAGKETNWVPTKPGGGFEVMFRAYAPTQAFFDKAWKLPDIERVN